MKKSHKIPLIKDVRVYYLLVLKHAFFLFGIKMTTYCSTEI